MKRKKSQICGNKYPCSVGKNKVGDTVQPIGQAIKRRIIKLEAMEIIKNQKDVIGWVRHFALPYKPIKDFKTTDTLILVTFRSDEHYIFRYFNEFGLIDAFLIQNLLDRITKYTQEAFIEQSGLNKTLEIFENKKEEK